MTKIDAIQAALRGDRPQLILQCPGKRGDAPHRTTHTLLAADGTAATAGVWALCAGCGKERMLVGVKEIERMKRKDPPKPIEPSLHFAQALREFRAERTLTVREAVLLIPGLSPRTWQAWEAGQQEPPAWAQALVLFALNVIKRPPPGARVVRAVVKGREVKRKLPTIKARIVQRAEAWTVVSDVERAEVTKAKPWSDSPLPMHYMLPGQPVLCGRSLLAGTTATTTQWRRVTCPKCRAKRPKPKPKK